ncbi:hypothetical protein A1Q1_01808 [Trichosporon asahii var. asahii CBS 2479]|uniref:Uncharacterized protein n=1 Tax=Trichosporon asahii var. asahii (strain ATCC 90039 / CBS 2479 / JCM 2466 / KCTC 7840 / NBRC 103889/ NCYC 2677 / UAMH 7654) TaxID=1186058 RepID=J6EX06_TRIAS|nr:hypothetical protein A1Q1_01808 [Trichosporon asahii var. asahii CBS 2479]EJT49159.1 hypothetical protein A1Q1_01808 [Trichosporon asahii var. asahii CBS 2479]
MPASPTRFLVPPCLGLGVVYNCPPNHNTQPRQKRLLKPDSGELDATASTLLDALVVGNGGVVRIAAPWTGCDGAQLRKRPVPEGSVVPPTHLQGADNLGQNLGEHERHRRQCQCQGYERDPAVSAVSSVPGSFR